MIVNEPLAFKDCPWISIALILIKGAHTVPPEVIGEVTGKGDVGFNWIGDELLTVLLAAGLAGVVGEIDLFGVTVAIGAFV